MRRLSVARGAVVVADFAGVAGAESAGSTHRCVTAMAMAWKGYSPPVVVRRWSVGWKFPPKVRVSMEKSTRSVTSQPSMSVASY